MRRRTARGWQLPPALRPPDGELEGLEVVARCQRIDEFVVVACAVDDEPDVVLLQPGLVRSRVPPPDVELDARRGFLGGKRVASPRGCGWNGMTG